MDEKAQIITALRAWIAQRPGLEYGNYGDPTAYRREMRSITKDRHHAEQLIRAVELSSMTAEQLKQGFSAYSGRLEWKLVQMNRLDSPCADCGVKPNREHLESCKGGQHSLEGHKLTYCTGQYWPTEYRRAVCAVCASALWNYYRDDMVMAAKPGESPGDAIRRGFRIQYGKRMQERWFN